ncbi:MAG: ABC transporter substrate-binding protein, partial [Pseudoclavibacter sp.]
MTIALVGLTACSAGGDTQAQSGETAMLDDLTFGVDRQPHSLDPYKSVLGGQFMAYLDPIYDTLIHQETDGSYTPGLATEWSYISLTEFELVLREDVVFSDGETPFDATAVQKNLDRLKVVSGGQTPELAPMYESTEIVDDHRVIIHLASPNPDLERILSQVLGMMANPRAIDDGVDLALDPQGVGAFTLDLDRTVVGDTYIYKKVDDYWDAAAYPFEQLTVKVYTDRNAMLSALQSGVAMVGYGQADTMQTAEGYGLGIATLPVVLYLLNFIGRDTAPLDDVRVRQALNYAVDRESILETLYHGLGTTTRQMFPEGTATGYDPALEEEYPY